MHEIFEAIIPELKADYIPTYDIILDIQKIYDIAPLQTLECLKYFSKFKIKFHNYLINRLKFIEKQTKENEAKHLDYFMIKGDKELESNLSIHSLTNLRFYIINFPCFLYHDEICNLNKIYFQGIQNTLAKNDECDDLVNHFLSREDNIMALNGHLVYKDMIKILRYKVLNCTNDNCLDKNIFYLIYRNGMRFVYRKEEGHYFFLLDFNFKCKSCNLKLQEHIKMRFIEEFYEYNLIDKLYDFPCISKTKIKGNLFLGHLKRTEEGRLIFNILSGINSMPNRAKVFNLDIQSPAPYIQREEIEDEEFLFLYTGRHFKFVPTINKLDIITLLVLHLFFLYDCSVIIFTNEIEYLKILSKHFIELYNLEIKIFYELDTENGLYILDKNYFIGNTKNIEILENADFKFRIIYDISKMTELQPIKYREIREIYLNITEFDPKYLNQEFEELSEKFFNKQISSEKIMQYITSFFLILQNIIEKDDKILEIIEKYFLDFIL